ncbi:MAG: Omp28 family outer membrane lipoprotein [Bacteroidia bacterium]|nr:Omp28 family outer membrane lipoprotein [Bacteroidia bacterium]
MHTKVFYFIGFFIFFLSCDKISNPIEKKEQAIGNNYVYKNNYQKNHFRKILLEDYTGHKCGNCPAAAIVAENLYNQYKDTLIILAVHAGFFAKTDAEYPTSYTTTCGNIWDGPSGFNISALGNPNGMVNRKNYGSGLVKNHNTWPSYVQLALNEPFEAKIYLNAGYDSAARSLIVKTGVKFLQNINGETKLCLVLYEDSIIGPQKDYTKNPDKVPNYVFMHMLRGDINGAWGETLKNNPSAGDSLYKEYLNIPVSANWKDKHLYLVGFVYHAGTKNIIQVEKLKIR